MSWITRHVEGWLSGIVDAALGDQVTEHARQRSTTAFLCLCVVAILILLLVLLVFVWDFGNDDPTAFRERMQGLLFAVGVLGAVLTGFIVPIRLLYVHRQTKTAEQGLITDRLTKAVEQLGAEKTIKVREFKPKYKVDNDGEWRRDKNNELIPATRPDGSPLGEWETYEKTVPNLEVRLGAIYALERIAQDSERDHIPVMETLCAYIRENAGNGEPKTFPLTDWPEWVDPSDADGFAEREAEIERRQRELRDGIASLGLCLPPKVDIAAIFDVFKRRTEARRVYEEKAPFYLDLRRANLQRLNLTGVDLRKANLGEARIEGASLYRAQMQGVDLDEAQMQGADLRNAQMQGATLRSAQMQGASLYRAQMQRANLNRAQMEGADLNRAQMQGADLYGATLNSADLARWSNRGTRARSAEFSEIRNLTVDHVNAMFGDAATVLPHGMDRPPEWDTRVEIKPGDPTEDTAYQDWLRERGFNSAE